MHGMLVNKLQQACHLQTCCNLLKRLLASLWITSFYNQLATRLLTTSCLKPCERILILACYQQVCCKMSTDLFQIAGLIFGCVVTLHFLANFPPPWLIKRNRGANRFVPRINCFSVLYRFDERNECKLRVRSMVGLIPLYACLVINDEYVDKLPGFRKRMDWFLKNREDLRHEVGKIVLNSPGPHSHLFGHVSFTSDITCS